MRERFNGTLRFSSRAANRKTSIGRKDELESWVYSMIFLLNGELPWCHISATNIRDANDEVLMLKTKSRSEMLTGLPPIFG